MELNENRHTHSLTLEHTHTHTHTHTNTLTLSSGDPLHADPPQDEHGAVVVDVEEADLVELLPQDEEHRVQELHSLGDVVPPQGRRYLKTRVRTTC